MGGGTGLIGDPSGKFVYIGEDTNPGRIFAYQYTATGVLTAVPGSPVAATGAFIEGLYITH